MLIVKRAVRAARISGTFMAVAAISYAAAQASDYTQTNLVANIPGLAANTDPNLVNPWGMSFSATSPFWISDQVTGLSTLYTGTGAPQALVVTVPGGVPPNNGPTGQVFAGGLGFSSGGPAATFIFDTQGGTINAWSGGTVAGIVATVPGANFTGLAVGSSGGANYLYAANVNGGIDVFDTGFNLHPLPGSFTDPALPSGFVPFNIQAIGGRLYVTYGQFAGDTPLPGGIVDVYDTAGNLLQRLSSDSSLFAPWGITLSPAGFGTFGNDLLVGNFGNGEITAFNPVTGAFLGTLLGNDGLPLVNESLWALEFRTGGAGVDPNALYFTAGLVDESGGLFGAITPTPTPEPGSLVLVALGMGPVLAAGWRRLRG